MGRSGGVSRPPGSSLSVIGLHDVGARPGSGRLSPPRFFRSEHLFPRPRRRGKKKRGKNKANKASPNNKPPAASQAAAAAVVSAAAAAVASVLTTNASTSSTSTRPAVAAAATSDLDAVLASTAAAVAVPNSTAKLGALAKNQELIRAALSTLSEKEAALSSVPIQVST